MHTRHAPVIATCLIALLAGLGPIANAADELNIYSYRQSFLTKPFIERFETETGSKINIVFMKKGMLERLKAEGANSPADLIMTVDIARLHALAEAGLLQPVKSSVLEANIPAPYRAEDGLWYGLTTRARVIYASKERVKPDEIRTYEDLADTAQQLYAWATATTTARCSRTPNAEGSSTRSKKAYVGTQWCFHGADSSRTPRVCTKSPS